MTRPSSGAAPNERRLFARTPLPRTDRPTTLAVLSDVHFTSVGRGTSKQLHRTGDHLRTAAADVADRDVDAVLCLGDLVQGGRREAYDAVDDALDRIDAPVYAVPGNHDAITREGVPTLPHDAFVERYAPDPYPFSVEVGGLTVLGVNTESGTDDPMAGLDPAAVPGESTLCCLHRPLSASIAALERCAAVGDESFPVRDPFARAARVESFLRQAGVALVASGHLHVPLVAPPRDGPGTGTDRDWTEVVAPPLCTYPQGYLLCHVDDGGARLEFVPVADGDALAETKRARADCSDRDRALTAVAERILASLPRRARTSI